MDRVLLRWFQLRQRSTAWFYNMAVYWSPFSTYHRKHYNRVWDTAILTLLTDR